MNSDTAAGTDLIDRAAIAYLALPLVIFFAGWFEAVPAAILILAVLFGTAQLMRGPVARVGIGRGWLIAASVLACVWAGFGGAGHLLYANEFDWRIRDAVLHDLVVAPWPVAYGDGQIADLVLRAPIAYFLPAALVAKAVGIAHADLLLFIWTVGGVALFMALGLQALPSRLARTLWLAALPWFSGMDALAWWWFKAHDFSAGQHIEWWAIFYQYSSTSTLLFWVPNHALAGWIAAALLVKHWRQAGTLMLFAFLFAATVLWSPLVTIGLLPFLVGWLVGRWRAHGTLLDLVDTRSFGVAAAMGLAFAAVGKWTTVDTTSIPIGFTFDGMALHASIVNWFAFQVAEWALLAVLVYRCGWRHPAFIPACICLLILPVFKFGIANDLVMRTSIIPLAVLGFGAVWALAESIARQRWRNTALLSAVLLVGVLTPAQEFIRAVSLPSWRPDLNSNLQEVSGVPRPSNYVARWSLMPPYLTQLMRAPAAPVARGGLLTGPADRHMPSP